MDSTQIFWMQLLTSVVVFGIVAVWYVWPSPNQTFSQFCASSAALRSCAPLCGNDAISCGYGRSETAHRVSVPVLLTVIS